MSFVSPVGWSLETPAGVVGAVGVLRLHASDASGVDGILAELKIRGIRPGEIRLCGLLGIDTGIVARWGDRCVYLMPHGGTGVVRALGEELVRRGVPQQFAPKARDSYPEATSDVEAEMLLALAQSPSPMAIDLLLDQPALWSVKGATSNPLRDRVLNRLIDPPLVVAIGASNIGKSTLMNSLAGRSVALVADEPGTTRDHVGVMLDFGGLVVRYVDTPGIRSDAPEIESQAANLATELALRADLVLLCGDGENLPPSWADFRSTSGLATGARPAGESIRVALRSDRSLPKFDADATISVRNPGSVLGLVSLVAERLVPRETRARPEPWKFWERVLPDGAAS